jgi:hypothetical protein
MRVRSPLTANEEERERVIVVETPLETPKRLASKGQLPQRNLYGEPKKQNDESTNNTHNNTYNNTHNNTINDTVLINFDDESALFTPAPTRYVPPAPTRYVPPAVQNPSVQNPSVQNPSVQNPSVQNPSVQNPSNTFPDNFESVFNRFKVNQSLANNADSLGQLWHTAEQLMEIDDSNEGNSVAEQTGSQANSLPGHSNQASVLPDQNGRNLDRDIYDADKDLTHATNDLNDEFAEYIAFQEQRRRTNNPFINDSSNLSAGMVGNGGDAAASPNAQSPFLPPAFSSPIDNNNTHTTDNNTHNTINSTHTTNNTHTTYNTHTNNNSNFHPRLFRKNRRNRSNSDSSESCEEDKDYTVESVQEESDTSVTEQQVSNSSNNSTVVVDVNFEPPISPAASERDPTSPAPNLPPTPNEAASVPTKKKRPRKVWPKMRDYPLRSNGPISKDAGKGDCGGACGGACEGGCEGASK